MSEWDGVERRKGSQYTGFCSQHISLTNDISVIKTSLVNIEREMARNFDYRKGLVLSLFGVSAVVIIQLIGFSFLYGGLVTQVSLNSEIMNTELKTIKEQIYDLNYIKGRSEGILEKNK